MIYQASAFNLMMEDIYGLTTSKSSLVYAGASLGFILATPIAGVVLRNNWMTRRGLGYVGYNILAIGMIFRTGDFG